ncbi:MAG: hypothetical protein ABIR70_05165 [Bryobacteraceae bacterium]
MERLTRRQMIKSGALVTLMTQVACTQRECAEAAIKFDAEDVYYFYTGQDASEVLARLDKANKKTGSTMKVTPRTDTVPPLTGGISDSVGGPAPPSAAPPASFPVADGSRNATDPNARAFYLLDGYGDATVDGRVVAYQVTPTSLTQRGSVTLRAAVFNGSTLELTDIALSSDGRFLIVSQAGNPPQWIFIDTATLTIAGRLMAPVGVFPRRCAIAADGKLAYAVTSGLQFDAVPQPLSVQVLDTTTRTIVGSIPLPANTAISDWTITPDQGLLFGVGGRFLHVVDVATLSHSASVDIIAPLGSTAFVSGNVERLVIHPNGDRLYAIVRRFPNVGPQVAAVAVIDVRTAQKIEEWPLRYPAGTIGPRIGMAPNGRMLLAGFQRGTEVQTFDPTLSLELETITLGADFGFATFAVA